MIIKPAKYWEDYAYEQISRIYDYEVNEDLATLQYMRDLMDEIIDKFFTGKQEMVDQEYWLRMASTSLAMNPISVSDKDLTNIVVKKQRDYGPQNIARFGLIGIIVRMHDKIARLENLITSGRMASNESIQDTFVDIVGYSSIALMWMNNQFLTPLREANTAG